jgi:hypothetical protein
MRRLLQRVLVLSRDRPSTTAAKLSITLSRLDKFSEIRIPGRLFKDLFSTLIKSCLGARQADKSLYLATNYHKPPRATHSFFSALCEPSRCDSSEFVLRFYDHVRYTPPVPDGTALIFRGSSASVQAWLNKFLYLPPLGTLLLNLIFFAVALTLAGVFGLFSDSINAVTAPLFGTDHSLQQTILLLLAVLTGAFALIYGRTEKYFLCPHECLRASAGSTVAVTLLYAGVWTVIQIGKAKETFVFFDPSSWSAQITLNNFKYGGLLFLFSSISLAGSLAISGRLGYDFSTFVDDWKTWKTQVQKLARNQSLTYEEHSSLIASMESMLSKARDMRGYSQPVSKARVQKAYGPLAEFRDWYEKQTRITYANCKGLDPSIQQQAQKILNLC